MFSVNLEDYFRTIRNLTFADNSHNIARNPDGSLSKPGVVVGIDCRISDPETDQRKCGYFQVVLCGNTNTFVSCKEDAISDDLVDFGRFVNVSNHDSCWVDAIYSEFWRYYFKWCKEVSPEKAPHDLSTHCWPGMFNNASLVTVTYKHCLNDGYKNILTNVVKR